LREVTDDRADRIEALRGEHEITNAAWFGSPAVFAGSVPEILARMRTVRDQPGVSSFVVFEH